MGTPVRNGLAQSLVGAPAGSAAAAAASRPTGWLARIAGSGNALGLVIGIVFIAWWFRRIL